jgi:hypothetical protein
LLIDGKERGKSNQGQSERELVRDHGRARTYAALYSFAVLTFAYVAYFVEGADLVTSFDDLTVVGVGVVALLFLAVRWRKPSLLSLARLNNILFMLGLWMIVFSMFAVEIEAGFPDDLVDEVPKLIVSLLLAVNRFV